MNANNLKQFFHELTDLISVERKTVFTFILIALMVKFVFWRLSTSYLSQSNDIKFSYIESSKLSRPSGKSEELFKGNLFLFDPASASREELISLGFSPKVADILINYRTKGGQFRDKSDVKKIYGVSPEFYAKLEPYIRINHTNSYKEQYPEIIKEKIPNAIDINRATKEEWKSLPGIGEYFAQKILDKRLGLGAFVEIEQIAEIYNLPDTTFQKIKPYLKLGKGTIKKININAASESELRQHPYILRWQAEDILRNRPIYGLDDLYDLKTYSDKSKNKFVSTYFEF